MLSPGHGAIDVAEVRPRRQPDCGVTENPDPATDDRALLDIRRRTVVEPGIHRPGAQVAAQAAWGRGQPD